MNRVGVGSAILVFALLLGGCSSFAIPRSHVAGLKLDAKRRAIIVAPALTRVVNGSPTQTSEVFFNRVCAEPPPDALSAISAGASGEISGLSKDPDVKAKAALAIAESASAIERTQTINLLRESMYRTCERYLNGAIGRDEFIVQAARDQKAMVAILAIEQLTQAARPAPVVLAPGGVSTSLGSDMLADLKKASDAKVAADNSLKSANARLTAADEQPDKKCSERLAAGDSDNAAAECKAAAAEVAKATDAATAAEAWLGTLERVSANGGSATTAAVSSPTSASSGGTPTGAQKDMASVAEAVVHISDSVKYDEIVMLCVLLSRKGGQLTDQCDQYLQQRINTDLARSQAEEANYNRVFKQLETDQDRLRDYLNADFPARWLDLIENAAKPAHTSAPDLDAMQKAGSADEAVRVFNQLISSIRQRIMDYVKERGG